MASAGDAVASDETIDRATRGAPLMDALTLGLWSAVVIVPAMALPAANWTDDLGYVPLIALVGLGLGAILVMSRLRGRAAALLSIGYGFLFILWELTSALDPTMAWRERVLDLAARVASFVGVVLAGEPSRDSLMFVLAMSIVFWTAAVFGTWWLFRRGGLWLAALIPAAAVFLNVYYYRFGTRLQLYLPLFVLAVLGLVVRVELNRRRRDWERRRAQVAVDVSTRVTQAGIAAAALLVFGAWMAPSFSDAQASSAGGSAGSRSLLGDFFSDALAGLRSPVNLYGETFGTALELGAGRQPGDRVVLRATAREPVPAGSRVYWRARAYDTYQDGGWQVRLGNLATFRPRQGDISLPPSAGRVEVEFTVSPLLPAIRLMYAPEAIAWLNRSADLRQIEAGGQTVDVLEATSVENLLPGDSYRVRARLAAPLAGDLEKAGTDYPPWVKDAYLQLPAGFSSKVVALADEIAGAAATPYGKAQAITAWLRANIRYQREIPPPPAGRDPIEWFLFDSRLGFCDYYASAAVLMLRSQGVPSRLAAGYAEGVFDPKKNEYLVSESDVHSWPEVYFPGYGWVEFEPTVSQPPLDRSSGQSANGGAAGAGGSPTGETAGGAAAGQGANELDRLSDVEDIQIAETQPPPSLWPAYVAAAFAAASVLVYVTPARRVAARWAVAGTRRVGLRAPPIVQEWAWQPASEAAIVFRRLAPWPGRLGTRLGPDATPADRGRSMAAVMPRERETVAFIVEAYSAERYGGVPAPRGDVARAWRSLRPHLYRARLARLLDAVLGGAPEAPVDSDRSAANGSSLA